MASTEQSVAACWRRTRNTEGNLIRHTARHSRAGTNKPLLRESQRSWLKYQESTCKLYEALMTFEGQGVARLSAAGCLLPLTLQRLEELRWMANCFDRRCAD